MQYTIVYSTNFPLQFPQIIVASVILIFYSIVYELWNIFLEQTIYFFFAFSCATSCHTGKMFFQQLKCVSNYLRIILNSHSEYRIVNVQN